MSNVSVVALAKGKKHGITKQLTDTIELLQGHGVKCDAHCGERVKHRSRARFNPALPNLRQVHLIQSALYGELSGRGFGLSPGTLGENMTLVGIDLLALKTGDRIEFQSGATIQLTGLRNPCKQLEAITPGLMEALLDRDEQGGIIRKGGVMGIVISGGAISLGDTATIVAIGDRPLHPV